VEPFVITGADGTIHVAWISLQFKKSATYYDEGPEFQTQILYSSSTDGGNTFSPPTVASPVGSYFDPSIALLPKGDVLLSYTEVGGNLIVARRSVQSSSFQQVATIKNMGGHNLDRPWIAASKSGIVDLIWSDPPNVFWARSTDGGVTFSSPLQVGFGQSLNRRLWWPTGLVTDENDTVHVSMLGWSFGALNPDQVWYARKPNDQGSFEVKQLATIQVPYGLYFNARMTFHPGPAIAANGRQIVIIYVSENGRSLYELESHDDGINWTPPFMVRSSSTLKEMPWVTNRGGVAYVAWRETEGGFWNTYASKLTKGKELSPTKVSERDGYPDSVLNWHGDFLGIDFLAAGSVIIVWSDGRGIPIDYGYGHIYVQVVRL